MLGEGAVHPPGETRRDVVHHQVGLIADLALWYTSRVSIRVRGNRLLEENVATRGRVRRRDNLRGKKLVVWCFAFREFTVSITGWRTVPVIR